MLFAFRSSLMQPLHVGPHHMPHKTLDSISTDPTPSSSRKPSLNPTLNVDLALKEKLSCTGGSQPGRNHCSLSFLKQIRHGQYISACQALSCSPCASPPPSLPLTRFLSPQFPIPAGTTISTSQLVGPGPGQSNWPRKASFLDAMACQGSSSLLAGY